MSKEQFIKRPFEVVDATHTSSMEVTLCHKLNAYITNTKVK